MRVPTDVAREGWLLARCFSPCTLAIFQARTLLAELSADPEQQLMVVRSVGCTYCQVRAPRSRLNPWCEVVCLTTSSSEAHQNAGTEARLPGVQPDGAAHGGSLRCAPVWEGPTICWLRYSGQERARSISKERFVTLALALALAVTLACMCMYVLSRMCIYGRTHTPVVQASSHGLQDGSDGRRCGQDAAGVCRPCARGLSISACPDGFPPTPLQDSGVEIPLFW